MKKLLALLTITPFLAAWGTEPTGNEVTTDVDSSIVDASIDTVVESTFPDQASNFFSADWINMASGYERAFHGIQSEEGFRSAFRLAKQLTDKGSEEAEQITNKMWEEGGDGGEFYNPAATLEKQLAFLVPHLPAIEFSTAAEGTVLVMSMNYKEFKAKATTTPGSEDDALMELLIAGYGEIEWKHSNMGMWFEQTWDYGGSSGLGRGIHLKLLKMIDNMKGSAYEEYADVVRTSLLADILSWNSYWETQGDILKEMDAILENISLSDDERKQMEQRKGQFQDPERFDLDLNCKEEECSYG